MPAYRALAAPSEKVPVMRFGRDDPGLYRRILERCVEPGTRCMSETMQHQGPHGTAIPPRGVTTPADKPEGAIFKEGEDKGSGSNVTKPAPPAEAPGVEEPGAPANRNLS